ncbi:MAG: heat-inducible transcriptional repressor HrcA [Deltaproteobacteria bacterium]|jgi:heat-inducible transcriptional repressor|nr:heat-inducible transcriptional repressor HrcA [Deltaproteobacteria bacterium]
MTAARTRQPTEGEASISDRQKRIFEAVVLDYIRTGEPVASGNLSERHSMDLSAASIRKVLHELEELGLLSQAHPSAGRTPTEEGFRFYADDILEVKRLPAGLRAQIQKEILSSDFRAESMFSLCSRVLSNLTSHMGLVMAPAVGQLSLLKLYFERLGESQHLAVLLTRNGIIQNRVVVTPQDFSQEELNEVNVFLESLESPFTLGEVRARLMKDMAESRSEFERIFKRAFLLASGASEAQPTAEGDRGPDIYMDGEGRQRLLEHPDFRDAEAMRALYRAFENKRRLVELLNDVTGGGRVRVVIGPSGEGEDGLALVASPYRAGGGDAGALGAIGVLGPRRLNYSEIVPVVDYAAQVLSGIFHK